MFIDKLIDIIAPAITGLEFDKQFEAVYSNFILSKI